MKSETGKVESVNISEEKHTVKTPVKKIVTGADGIIGDAHAGHGLRQVSILARENIDLFGEQIGRKIASGEFAENITTIGLDTSGVSLLDRFDIGGVQLEVTQIGKKCHGDNCAIFREVGKCVMPKQGIFCRVITGGTVKAGDAITFTPRPFRFHIITLSDRASMGRYSDRSGPRVGQIVRDFFKDKKRHCCFESTVLPDDSEKLKKQLCDAVGDNVDVIFTTGGTGVGPRDITVDTVMSLARKTVPGIMEYIRLKYGAEKPNALLSRSVAVVIGKTLVYTLPGSVKAVNEYVPEILKTLEHLIFTLHRLDTH